jgi:hypothetical protein
VRIFTKEITDHDQVERHGSSYQCMECRETPANMWHHIIRLNKGEAIFLKKKLKPKIIRKAIVSKKLLAFYYILKISI